LFRSFRPRIWEIIKINDLSFSIVHYYKTKEAYRASIIIAMGETHGHRMFDQILNPGAG
jgi:hypothetical protein